MITNENKTRKKEFERNYLKFWLKLFSFRKKLKTWDIDFNKPWWYIFWQHKFLILPTFITESIQSIFWVCLPIILVYSFDSRQYFWLISALIFRIILVPIVWLIYHNWVRFVEVLDGSVWISTGKYFLTVDPIYHSTQSSGQVVSKINRAAQGYFDLVTLISWEIISLVIGALSVIISSIFINLWIGIYLGLTLGFMTIINIWLTRFNDSIFQENRIPIEDDKKDSELENLQQASYIRTVFATKNQLNKQISKTTKLITLNFASWRSSGLIWSLLLIFYFLTGLGLVFKLISMVESYAITSPTAIALVSSFFLGTTNILQAGNQTQRLTRSIISITDLFDFIRGFGKQTFSVLEENAE